MFRPDDGYYIEPGEANGGSQDLQNPGEESIRDWLDGLGVHYLYEPHCYRLGEHRGFQPDYYIPEWDLYIECCGKHVYYKYRKLAVLNRRWPRVKVAILNPRAIRKAIKINDKHDALQHLEGKIIRQKAGSELHQIVKDWERGYVHYHYPGLAERAENELK
jgi:hypothetical protein